MSVEWRRSLYWSTKHDIARLTIQTGYKCKDVELGGGKMASDPAHAMGSLSRIV